jgi:uncharacterized protein
MKRFIIAIVSLIFIFCGSLYAQDSLKKGHTVFYYENGKISSEGILTDGKPDGYWKTYNENGFIKSEGNRKNFKLDSLWKFYNDSGKVILEINYTEGKKNGIKTTYQEKEKITETYVEDIKQGPTTYYYPDGTVRLIINFIKGREQGFAKEFSADGTVISLIEYKNGYLLHRENINRKDKNGLKQGNWKEYYSSGILKSEGTYYNDVKSGYFKDYDVNGNLTSVSKYVNGELIKDAQEVAKVDTKTDYYSTGKVKVVGSYKNNVPDGVMREYSPEGKITDSKIFKEGVVVGDGIIDAEGVRQGAWKEYYNTGELKGEGTYVNGQRIGDWKYYHQNGKIEQIGKFLKNEKPDGPWKWYFENGNLLREETFENGMEIGTMIEYNDTGVVVAKGDFVDGLEEGPWFYHYGDFTEEGSYKEGKRFGEWKGYYLEGNLLYSCSYTDDNYDGKYTTYWDNGNIKETGLYIMGQREGDWYRYNYDGTVFLITTYKNGIEIKYDGIKIKPPLPETNE